MRESDLKIAARLAELDRLKVEAMTLIQQQRDELSRLSSLSADEARQQLLHRVELDTQAEAAALVRRTRNKRVLMPNARPNASSPSPSSVARPPRQRNCHNLRAAAERGNERPHHRCP